jgi:predicted metal-dependent HD superfamily phosphohydrolase
VVVLTEIVAAPELERLQQAYSAKTRHYHTWTHVQTLLAAAARDDMATVPVTLAILYHDVVYGAPAKDNEAKSAEALEAAWRDHRVTAGPDDIAAAKHMINLGSGDAASDWFWDADREILAAPEQVYDAYAAAVCKEYKIYPMFLYKRGRAKFIETELARPHIYRTESFRARFDAQARANLTRELRRYR